MGSSVICLWMKHVSNVLQSNVNEKQLSNPCISIYPPPLACSVLYLGSVDTESLTGPQAISKASTAILTPPRSSATSVHFKVSDQGITLTDSERK